MREDEDPRIGYLHPTVLCNFDFIERFSFPPPNVIAPFLLDM